MGMIDTIGHTIRAVWTYHQTSRLLMAFERDISQAAARGKTVHDMDYEFIEERTKNEMMRISTELCCRADTCLSRISQCRDAISHHEMERAAMLLGIINDLSEEIFEQEAELLRMAGNIREQLIELKDLLLELSQMFDEEEDR